MVYSNMYFKTPSKIFRLKISKTSLSEADFPNSNSTKCVIAIHIFPYCYMLLVTKGKKRGTLSSPCKTISPIGGSGISRIGSISKVSEMVSTIDKTIFPIGGNGISRIGSTSKVFEMVSTIDETIFPIGGNGISRPESTYPFLKQLERNYSFPYDVHKLAFHNLILF